MQLVKIPVFTDAENAILSNLPNGSDIDEDEQMFGKSVVDALAAKLEAKAIEASQALTVRAWNTAEESAMLMILIECVLNLQRMKRYDAVKRLLRLDKDGIPHPNLPAETATDLTKDEEWVLLESRNGVPMEAEQERIGKAAMDVLANKVFAKAVRMVAVLSDGLDTEEARKSLRTYLGLARTLNTMKRSHYVRQLMRL